MPSASFQSGLSVCIEMSQFQVPVVFLRYFTAVRFFFFCSLACNDYLINDERSAKTIIPFYRLRFTLMNMLK